MRRFGMPATARASFYVYNTKEEVDALVARLAKAETSSDLDGGNVALDDMYKEVILDHYKNPRNKHELPGGGASARATTRCAATRSPSSCTRTATRSPRWRSWAQGARSRRSSASMMTEAVTGKQVDEAKRSPPSSAG